MTKRVWEDNLRVLREQFPALAEQLEREAAPGAASGTSGDMRVETASSGEPALVVGGMHINSMRDPVREGRRAAEGIGAGDGPVVILGFGLGYAAEAAAEKAGDRALIVVECRKAVLRKALEVRDLRGLLRRRIVFVLGDGGAEAAGSAAVMGALRLFKGKPEIIRNRALMTLDEAWYAEAERHIETWASKDAVNQATLRRFGKRWVRNLAANMEAIRDLPGVGRLAGVLAQAPGDIPVLLAAAGPSLDGIVPYLPALAERCVVAAVDTSLNLLLKAGVDPDFALVVDPQYWNVRHLDRARAPKTCLIAESAVYPSVLRGFPSLKDTSGRAFERAYLCGSLFPLGRFIEERVDPKGALGAGGSVATTAWDFARLLGASSIWIAGLDLSFPGLKTHFKGALFENRALAESGRLDPAETRSVRALRDGLPFSAPSAEGGTVLTDRRLSLYAAWFENRFRLYPNLRNYSFSAGGLAIPGLIPARPEDLLALPPRREEINQRLGEIFARVEGDFYRNDEAAARMERYGAARRELLQGLEQVRTLAEKAAALAEKERTAGSGDTARVLAELDKANRAITSSAVKDVAGFLFPPMEELEAEARPQGTAMARHLELSARLYRALAETAGYHLRALAR